MNNNTKTQKIQTITNKTNKQKLHTRNNKAIKPIKTKHYIKNRQNINCTKKH